MQIMMIAVNDPAGMAIALTNAINRHTEHFCRLVTTEIRYNFLFEKDLHIPWLDDRGLGEVEQLLQTSDVFYFHTITDENNQLGPFTPKDYLKGKTIIHHHHGHPDFRCNPEKYREKYKKLKRENILVSTPDLLRLMPEAKWQPNLVPVNDPLFKPLEDKQERPVKICHTPTRRDLKNTDEFIHAVKSLQADIDIPIEMNLIENTRHTDCLRVKRQCHILFDHLQGYFGVSSLEGLSQGLAVVAGLDQWNREHIREITNQDDLPWIVAGENGLKKTLCELLADRHYLKQVSDCSRAFMAAYWNDQIMAEHLVSLIRKT